MLHPLMLITLVMGMYWQELVETEHVIIHVTLCKSDVDLCVCVCVQMCVGKPLTSYWLTPAVSCPNNKTRSQRPLGSIPIATLQVPPPTARMRLKV